MFESPQSSLSSFLLIALPFVFLEVLFARCKGKHFHDLKDSFCNLAILAINLLSKPVFVGFIYLSLKFVEGLAPFKLPENTATTVVAVIATDFVYYWQHRISHKNRYLWFFHEVHHSSKYFNLTTSFRLHWLGRLLAPIYFAPLVLVGFSPEQVTLFFVFNLFYQFFLHTRTIGKIPYLEGIFNTPSSHRVHHSRNKEYLNKNYGGILMLWDRLFNTYEPELLEPVFGTIGRFESNNPFTVQFHRFKGYTKITRILSNRLKPSSKSNHSSYR